MLVSYNWLQTYFKKPLPKAGELADAFVRCAFEVESLEEKNGDTLLDLKVLPDRMRYALCHRGIAGEAAAILSVQLEEKADKAVSIHKEVPALRLTVEDKELCRRYSGRIVENVSVGQSSKDCVDSLAAIGQRSINSIVDAANFVMFDMGQPLHAFDADKVKGGITVRKAKEGERIITLDNKDVALDSTILIIADDEGPLAIAGIKGGKRAEVDGNTTRLILESANFNPAAVRRASAKLGIRTDASKRFENDYSAELALSALEEFSERIATASPEVRFGAVADEYSLPEQKYTVGITLKEVSELLGAPITAPCIEDIFTRLSLPFERHGDPTAGIYTVMIPSKRGDIRLSEDLVEEIGRLYGYDNIQSTLPGKMEQAASDARYRTAMCIRDVLVSGGYSEVLLHTLTKKGDFEVAHALSDKSFLRTNLADGVAASLSRNVLNADLLLLDEVKIFEIGNVFAKSGEHVSLCIAASLVKKQKGRTASDVVTEGVAAVATALGIVIEPKITVLPNNAGAITELNLSELAGKVTNLKTDTVRIMPAVAKRFVPFSPYPFIVRDVAVFASVGTQANDVWAVIAPLAGELLMTHRLFDVFTKVMPDGTSKVSYAFRLVFQSKDRTLTDEDVAKPMEAITAVLNDREGWQVR